MPSAALIDAFCDQVWLQDGLAASSLASYRRDLTAWAGWLERNGRKHLLAAERGRYSTPVTLLPPVRMPSTAKGAFIFALYIGESAGAASMRLARATPRRPS